MTEFDPDDSTVDFDDSTIDPEDVNLESSPEELAQGRNADFVGSNSSALLFDDKFDIATTTSDAFSSVFETVAIGLAANQFVNSFLEKAGLSDILNNVDPGFGFINSGGSPDLTTENMLNYSSSSVSDNAENSLYENLDNILTESLSQDWTAQNSSPGNELIIEAYALSGRTYERDGVANEYNWNAAFVNWVLSKSGIDFIKSMSAIAYQTYGTAVDFGTFRNVRKNDIIILNTASNITSIGFVREFNRQTQQITVLGGNFGGKVKEIKVPFTRTSPIARIHAIRRNWTVPEEFDKPLFDVRPVRPGQETSGVQSQSSTGGRVRYTSETPAERRDRLSGGSAASGGTLA